MDRKGEIDALIDRVAERLGCEVVESDLFRSGRRQLLRIYIDKPGGVTVGDCQAFSRELGSGLDLEDLFDSPYTLEVSSPGLDRPLRTTKDYLRHVGKKIRFGLSQPIDGKKTLTARLMGADDEMVRLELTGGEVMELSRTLILQAKVEISF